MCGTPTCNIHCGSVADLNSNYEFSLLSLTVVMTSIGPSLFPPPVFDCLQCQEQTSRS